MTDTLTETEAAEVDEIVARQLGIERTQLTPEAGLMTDLNADSLDVVEICMGLEERFNLSIPDELAEGIKTMEDLHQAVADLLRRPR